MRKRITRSVLGAARSFHPRSAPRFARANYRRELVSSSFVPFAVTCVEGETLGVIALKVFDAGPLAISTIAAAPAMAFITSVFWTRGIRGRNRVPVVVTLQLVVAACVLAIALAPVSAAGTAGVVVAALVARVALTGLVAARADIWRTNYARAQRARIAGRITTVSSLTAATAAFLIGRGIDLVPEAQQAGAFRAAYAVAAALSLIGIAAFSRVRWRGGASVVAREGRDDADDALAPASLRGMVRVLRDDTAYRRYMSAQFVLGFANIGALAPLLLVIKKLNETEGLSFTTGLLLTQVLPLVVPLFVLPLWGRLLDRVHIVRFRVYHAWFFVLASALTAWGALESSIALLFAARVVWGIARGGGMLAWQLGHHDFAPRHLASVYMGIHVALTGVRGVLAPYLAVLLYEGFTLSLGGAAYYLGGIGGWVFALFAVANLVGALMFLKLDRDLGAEPTTGE